MDEQDWEAYRKRLRTRVSCQMLLVIGPLVALVAVVKIVFPTDYPVGDIRNMVEFRVLFYGLFGAFGVAITVAAVRWLRADRRA
jgi:hypothetical protein